MPLPTLTGNQVRLTVGSEEMTILLSGKRRRPDGYAVAGLTGIGQRLSGQLAQHLPRKARRLIKSTIGENVWFLDDELNDNRFFSVVGRLLLDPRAQAVITEIVIDDFVASRLRAKFSQDSYPPPLHSSVNLYLWDGDEPLNPHPLLINKVEVAGQEVP
jgi:hypothetical protein